MGFYAPAQIVRDAQEHGVEVRPVDVNLSDWDCTLERLRRPSARPACSQLRHAAMKRRHPHDARAAARLPPDQRAFRRARPKIERRAGAASIPCAISGCARGCRPPRWSGSRMPMRSARSGCPPRRAVGGARAAALRRQGRSAAVRARRHAGARARCRAAADAAGRAGGRGLSPSASVAEGASGVVPARRTRSPRHRAPRAPARHRRPAARDGRRPGAGAPAARHRQGRDLHDAGGRDRHRQHHRVAECSRRSGRSCSARG